MRDDQDGTFWMSVDDFVQFFDTVVVVKCRAGWHPTETARATELVSRATVFSLDVADASGAELYLYMFQDHRRSSAAMVGARMCVVEDRAPHYRPVSAEETYVISPIVNSNRLKLPTGRYLVMLDVHEEHARRLLPTRIVFGAYSSTRVAISLAHLFPPLPFEFKTTMPTPF
jgi:hypothetical protein